MAEENKILKKRCSKLEMLLKEEKEEAKYYRRIAEEGGRKRLREIDQLSRLITERKRMEEALQAKEKELKSQAQNLEEANTALKVLIDHMKQQSLEQEKNIMANLEKLVFPYMDKLQKTILDNYQKVYMDIIKANLDNITSGFAGRLSTLETSLTPMELQVADLLRQDKTTKEIAELLSLSTTTISFHRRNIRKKLGLVNKKVNIKSYLQSKTHHT